MYSMSDITHSFTVKLTVICQNFISAIVFKFAPFWILTFSQNILATGI